MSDRPHGSGDDGGAPPAAWLAGLDESSGPDDSAGTGPVVEAYGTGGLRSLLGRFSWSVVGESVNLVGTLLLFMVVAGQLGADGYGALQTVVAIAVIAGPLATFGANWQLIRRGVVADDFSGEVNRAVSIATLGTSGVAMGLVLGFVLMPSAYSDLSRPTIALILLAQMPAFWLAELAATAAVARSDLRLAAQTRIATIGARLGALGLFVVAGGGGVDTWAWYFAVGNLAGAVAAHGLLARSLGRWPQLVVPRRGDLVTGFPYGIGSTTEGILAASDRPLLSRYEPYATTGFYAAGYRVVNLGFVPMMAFFKAQDRRFFRQGAAGSAASHQASMTMAMHVLVVTIPVSVALWLLAPAFDLVVALFADDGGAQTWAEAESVIRLLALLPVIKGFQFSFGNGLTAAGNQMTRLVLTGIAATGNVVGNVIFIPRGSWEAAAVTTLVGEVTLAIALAIASHWHARRGQVVPVNRST